ncbi:endonuclease/exonuclease/phosphatase family protein [Sulfitobacter porphyrae]|uniref:Endonuclease/exonuclease/phosphatase family protein n=1 Tax=Sulfitobacter porphyrae TaxID=1246864 RepID=A0ABW2B7Y3_9RHOB
MRVASYNIRKAVGLDWRRDPDRIVDVLAEINADIIVLQEADRRVGTRAGVLPLDRLETEFDYIMTDVSLHPLSHGWHGNAILVRSRFADHVPERIELPTLEPRGAVSVRLEQPQLEVIGVHLGLTPGMRRKQMSTLQEVMKDRDHPVLLAGDFNEWNVGRLPFDAPQMLSLRDRASTQPVRPLRLTDLFSARGYAQCRHMCIIPLWRNAHRITCLSSSTLPSRRP